MIRIGTLFWKHYTSYLIIAHERGLALRFRILMVVFIATSLTACTTTVRLAVRNQSGASQDVSIQTKGSDGVLGTTIAVGTLDDLELRKVSDFEVDHGGAINVVASLTNGPMDYQTGDRTVFKKPDPLDVIVPIPKGTVPSIDDKSAADKLTGALSQLGPKIGFLPLATKNALKSVYGGPYCYVVGHEQGRNCESVSSEFFL
jgi:hypothetical protein